MSSSRAKGLKWRQFLLNPILTMTDAECPKERLVKTHQITLAHILLLRSSKQYLERIGPSLPSLP